MKHKERVYERAWYSWALESEKTARERWGPSNEMKGEHGRKMKDPTFDSLQSHHSDGHQGCCHDNCDLAYDQPHCAVLRSASLDNSIAGFLSLLADCIVCGILSRLAAGAAVVLCANVETVVLIGDALVRLDACVSASLIPSSAVGKHDWPLVLFKPRNAFGASAAGTHVLSLAEVGEGSGGIVASCGGAELHLGGAKCVLGLF